MGYKFPQSPIIFLISKNKVCIKFLYNFKDKKIINFNKILKYKISYNNMKKIKKLEIIYSAMLRILVVLFLGSALVFLSGKITGNAILDINPKTSNWIGIISLMLGILGIYLITKRKLNQK